MAQNVVCYKARVFWDVTQCLLVYRPQRFGEYLRLCLQGISGKQSRGKYTGNRFETHSQTTCSGLPFPSLIDPSSTSLLHTSPLPAFCLTCPSNKPFLFKANKQLWAISLPSNISSGYYKIICINKFRPNMVILRYNVQNSQKLIHTICYASQNTHITRYKHT
jgi:hypothetical protein